MLKIFRFTSFILFSCATLFPLAVVPVVADTKNSTPNAAESPAPEEEGLGELEGFKISFILIYAFIVFFMQVGFLAVETGSGRAKNVRNILLKNLVNVMLCAILWWTWGFAFAYGRSSGGFIGSSQFFYEGAKEPARPWLFSWTFCLACVTIVGGCLAERTQLVAYPVYTAVLASWVHPVMVHWIWSPESWLKQLSSQGCVPLDFAGCSVVHVSGGVFGFIGAWLCGPRLGRFEDGVVKDIPGHDMVFVALGTFMLWFGWYGFNVGSVYMYTQIGGYVARRVAVSTTLSASASGLVGLMVDSFTTGSYDVHVCCNCVMAGLAIITGCAGYISPWAAVVCGTVSGLVHKPLTRLLFYLRVDDPLGSSIIHLGSGVLGTILAGIFSRPEWVEVLTLGRCGGVLYTSRGWNQLGVQVFTVVISIAWSGFFALVTFGLLSRLGRLRVDQAAELGGIDNFDHGGSAYPEFNLVTIREERTVEEPSR